MTRWRTCNNRKRQREAGPLHYYGRPLRTFWGVDLAKEPSRSVTVLLDKEIARYSAVDPAKIIMRREAWEQLRAAVHERRIVLP